MTCLAVRPSAPASRLRAWPAALATLLLCLGTGARAGEPTDLSAYRDLRHTILARQAMLRDGPLAPHNVGVKVHNRIAILWGPVPSLQVRDRALLVLRGLPDLLEVRDETHVEEPETAGPEFLPEVLPRPDAALPGVGLAAGGWRGVLARRPGEADTPTAVAENVRLRPAPTDPDEEAAVLPSIAVPAPVSATEAAIRRLQQSEPRFRGLHVELRAGEARVVGPSARAEDLRALAAAVALVPGVRGVVLEQLASAPGRP
jgi:hypothetical protein